MTARFCYRRWRSPHPGSKASAGKRSPRPRLAKAVDSLPGARVEVRSDGGGYAERGKQEFVLLAGADGAAGAVCRDSMSSGRRSELGFTDRFAVHLPFWRYRVVAPGHGPGEWVELDVPEYRRQVRRVGPQRARLVVPVAVFKPADEPSR